MKESLQSMVYSRQLKEKVIFTGIRKDVPRLLQEIDMLIMPSLREGLPVIALEAMAAGVPVVATNVGGLPEVIKDGHTGLLVEAQNPLKIEEAIIQYLENSELKSRLVENARARVQEMFSTHAMLHSTEALYENLYSKRKPKSR